MTALLPCPHCGAPAFDFGGDLCGCSERCFSERRFGVYLMSYARWNRRTPLVVDDAMVERAYTELHRYGYRTMDILSVRAALEAAMNKDTK